MCARHWNEGPGNSTLGTSTPVWPSKEACCQAGGGAYESGEHMPEPKAQGLVILRLMLQNVAGTVR